MKRRVLPKSIVKPVPIISHAPLADTLWFPVEYSRIHGWRLFDLSSSFKRATGTSFRLFMLSHTYKQVAGELARLGKNPSLSQISRIAKLGFEGIIIPNHSIGEDWFFNRECNPELAMELAVNLALHVNYSQNFPTIGLYTADRALEALSIGSGNCYHHATILAAILRKNGFPSRIVGYNDDAHPNSMLNHWWVEILVNGAWMDCDSCFVQNLFLRAVSNVVSSGVPNSVSTIVAFLEDARANDHSVTFIDDKKKRYGMENRIIAAEFELPE